MKPARLQTTDKAFLRRASREAVEDYFTSLPATVRDSSWLWSGNRYRKECIERYKRDLASTAVNQRHLIAYISASTPTHNIDGWSLIARATESLLRGDVYSSLHLAYYAELRAAMSLLASEGIGIFSTQHPVILPSKISTHPIRNIRSWNPVTASYNVGRAGTHAIVWPILQHWAQQRRAAELIDQLIAPDGRSLSEWLRRLGVAPPVKAIAEGWLKTWGMDLSVLDEDHRARNLVSYRPSEFRPASEPLADATINFVTGLWSLFEPAGPGRFSNLERLLLRKALRQTRNAVAANELEAQLGMDPLLATEWATFLSDLVDPDPLVLSERSSAIESPTCAMEVISRAALLLFLATGATRRVLATSGYTSNTLSFFWKRQYQARAIGDRPLPDDPLDMWEDVSASIKEAQDWRQKPTSQGASLAKWRSEQASVVSQVGGFELPGIWGVLMR